MEAFSGIGKWMNRSWLFLNPAKLLLITSFLLVTPQWFYSSPVFAQTGKSSQATDLSTMDWSDSSAKESGPAKNSAKEIKAGEDLSKMNWADEVDNQSVKQEKADLAAERELDEAALDKKEGRIHAWGFLLFIGYILGCLLTIFFTRNRKLAVLYPPELLIVLHAVWPLELVFLLFAGKRVR